MVKLVQIPQTSKSNVILVKEGYKNKQIASRLGLSEASVIQILKQNKENVTLSLMKRSGWLCKTTPRTDQKLRRLLKANPFLTLTDIKRLVPELAEVSVRTICHCVNKDLKLLSRKPLRNHFLLQKWPSKGLNSATNTKVGLVKTGRKSCFWMNLLFHSLAATVSMSEGQLAHH